MDETLQEEAEKAPLESEIEIKQENNLDDSNNDPNWKDQFLNSPGTEPSAEPENSNDPETPGEPELVQAQIPVEPESMEEHPIIPPVRVKQEPVNSVYENASSFSQQPSASVRIKEEPKDTDEEDEANDEEDATPTNEAPVPPVEPPVEEPVQAQVATTQVKEEPEESDENEAPPESNDESAEDSDSDTIPYAPDQQASPRASPSSESDDTMDQIQDQNMETDEEEENEEIAETEDLSRDEVPNVPAPPAVGFSSSRDLDEINEEIMGNRRTVNTNGASSYRQGYSRASSGEESDDEEMPFSPEQEADVDDDGDGDAFIQYPSSPNPNQVEDGRSAQKRSFSTDPDVVPEQPQKKSRFRADKYVNPSSEPEESTSLASIESVAGPSSVIDESSSEQQVVNQSNQAVAENATEQPAIRAKVNI